MMFDPNVTNPSVRHVYRTHEVGSNGALSVVQHAAKPLADGTWAIICR
jgi:hypothetical protein